MEFSVRRRPDDTRRLRTNGNRVAVRIQARRVAVGTCYRIGARYGHDHLTGFRRRKGIAILRVRRQSPSCECDDSHAALVHTGERQHHRLRPFQNSGFI